LLKIIAEKKLSHGSKQTGEMAEAGETMSNAIDTSKR
jgi:hypothetical protein